MPIDVTASDSPINVSASGTKIDATVSGGQGPVGAGGPAATITVGTVTTGAPGSSASVVNAGTSSAAVLNFTIPAGQNGAAGQQGATGPAGATGAKGDTGDSGVAYATDPVAYDAGTKTVSLQIGDGLGVDLAGNLIVSAVDTTKVTTTQTYTNFLTEVGGGDLATALSDIDSALTGRALAADFDQGVKTTDSPEFAGLAFNAYAVDWAVAPRASLGASLDFKATVSGVTSTVFSVDSSGVITFADNTTQSTAAVPYTLPMASALTLGGVTIGSGIDVVLGQISVSTTSIGAAAASHQHNVGDLSLTATDVLVGRSSSGAGAGQEITCTAAGRALLDDATAADQRTTLSAQKTITSGTAAPTGGADGDIYLQYTA